MRSSSCFACFFRVVAAPRRRRQAGGRKLRLRRPRPRAAAAPAAHAPPAAAPPPHACRAGHPADAHPCQRQHARRLRTRGMWQPSGAIFLRKFQQGVETNA